jgi:predicted amidophosphoribosyltransferase
MVPSVDSKDFKQLTTAGLNAIADLVWPPSCPLCNQSSPSVDGFAAEFCQDCESALSVSEEATRVACRRCGVPSSQTQLCKANIRSVEGSRAHESKFALRATEGCSDVPNVLIGLPEKCVRCRNQVFEFEAILPLWIYEHRVRDAVVAAKYAHQTALGDALGRRLGKHVRTRLMGNVHFDLVTYIPSHFTRQFARGGNGNQIIAQAVARMLATPCRMPLRITRRIRKQAWLGDQARIKNVSGAFSLKKGYALNRSEAIAGKCILLVDDVLTTGATANEVARVLLAAGARTVSLAVVARAIRSI